jgi:hypothetical protein
MTWRPTAWGPHRWTLVAPLPVRCRIFPARRRGCRFRLLTAARRLRPLEKGVAPIPPHARGVSPIVKGMDSTLNSGAIEIRLLPSHQTVAERLQINPHELAVVRLLPVAGDTPSRAVCLQLPGTHLGDLTTRQGRQRVGALSFGGTVVLTQGQHGAAVRMARGLARSKGARSWSGRPSRREVLQVTAQDPHLPVWYRPQPGVVPHSLLEHLVDITGIERWEVTDVLRRCGSRGCSGDLALVRPRCGQA